jgi:hypothetical protein
MFLTDGYDNEWSKSEILKATASLRDVLSGAVFVEYGWCCNRSLMTEMAESVGGNLVFCENFAAYEPVLDSTLSKSLKSAKKVEVAVNNPLYDLVFTVSMDGPCVYKVEDGKVLVPEGTTHVYNFQEGTAAKGMDIADIAASPAFTAPLLVPVYQGVYLLAQRVKSKTVGTILAALGDVKLFKKFANCYGKQNLTDFQTMVLEASKGKMFEEGRDDSLTINPNAFTILDLLFLLAEDDGNLFVPKAMEYSRVSRATEDSMEDFTDEERAEIDALNAKAKNATDYKKVNARIAEIIASKPAKLEFTFGEAKGYPVSNLVWNGERPNVSIQVNMPGFVELPANAPANLPKEFPSSLFRNYNVIRDGVANIPELPVRLSKLTFHVLKKEGVVTGDWDADKVYMLNLRALPTINQSMVTEVSARSLFLMQYELTKLKAAQTVFNGFKKKWIGEKVSAGFLSKYGEESTLWLKEHGLTDSGFNPKKKQAESTDFYMGIEMNVAIKGISSIPSFNDFMKKINDKKPLTARESLLKAAYDECAKMETLNDVCRREWIENKCKETTAKTRELIRKLAEIKFGVIVGQTWFKEFKDLGENTLTVLLDGVSLECSVTLDDVKIKI